MNLRTRSCFTSWDAWPELRWLALPWMGRPPAVKVVAHIGAFVVLPIDDIQPIR